MIVLPKFLIIYVVLFATNLVHANSNPLGSEITAIESGLTSFILVKGKAIHKYSLEERMKHYNVPGVSIAVVKEGKLHWAKGYGVANSKTGLKVNIDTLFQAGSISKPIAALAALKLVDEAKVELDKDVNIYLTGWKIKNNEFTKQEKVTLRRLLSHTAGMTGHGFPGYVNGENIPSIENVLNGKGNTPEVFVDTIPGTKWRYSGGGYTVMEKLVEDISGLALDEYMTTHILKPMQMNNSTYAQPLHQKLWKTASAAFNNKGEQVNGDWHNYPEQAAAGLWTTPSDLAKYVIEIQNIYKGKLDGVLSQNTVNAMLSKHKGDWGLGPELREVSNKLIFQHGGKNKGFTNDMMAFAETGDGLIVMANGDGAGSLIKEIQLSFSDYYSWNTNNPKVVDLINLHSAYLETLTGTYQFTNSDSVLFEVSLDNGVLVLNNSSWKDKNTIVPLSKTQFIDMESGMEFTFQFADKSGVSGFVVNDYYQFHRL